MSRKRKTEKRKTDDVTQFVDSNGYELFLNTYISIGSNNKRVMGMELATTDNVDFLEFVDPKDVRKIASELLKIADWMEEKGGA